MKKIQLLSLLIVLVFMTSAHGTVAMSSVDQSTSVNIAIVYSTGGLGDQSFNDAAKDGIEEAVDEYGTSFSFDEACTSGCTTFTDISTAIDDFASSSEEYDLIIGVGFSALDGINATAQANPDQDFMIIDSVLDLPNVASVVFKEHEGSFLAGAMAGMVTETNKVAFLGGLDIPLINRFFAGYSHGAQFLNQEVTVSGQYSPDSNNPFGDISGGQQVADGFMDNGFDIIFAAAGGTGIGVINAVDARNEEGGDTQYYAIGVDSNQDYLAEGDVLTSMVKRVDVAIKQQIDALFDGTWSAGLVSLGLAEDAVGLTPMEYTQDELTAEYVPDFTREDVIDDLKERIISGNITVAETLDEVDPLLADQGNYEADVPTDSESSPSDELSLPVFALFIPILAVPILRRRNE